MLNQAEITKQFFNTGLESEGKIITSSGSWVIAVADFHKSFEVSKLTNLEWQGFTPTAWIYESDIAKHNIEQDNSFVFDGTAYKVLNIYPDGEGMASLILGVD